MKRVQNTDMDSANVPLSGIRENFAKRDGARKRKAPTKLGRSSGLGIDKPAEYH